MTNGITWIVCADGNKANIYLRRHRFSQFEAVQSLDEPEARLRERDLVSAAPGRSFDSVGQGRHAMEPDHTEKHRLKQDFAHRIVDVVESGRKSGQFGRLALVAAPAMLGMLRNQLSDTTAKLIVAEISKDVTCEPTEVIAKLLDAEH